MDQMNYHGPVEYYPQPMYTQQMDPRAYDPNMMATPSNFQPMTMAPHTDSCGPSPFLPDNGASPYLLPMQFTDHRGAISPMMDTPSYHGADLHRNNSMPLTMRQDQQSSRPRTHSAQGLSRPPLQRNHTMGPVPQRPNMLQRQASLQVPPRSASPHMLAGDLFDPVPGSPIKRAVSSLGLPASAGMDMPRPQEFVQDMFFSPTHGISPARALGPAPGQQRQRYSPVADNPMITPQPQNIAIPTIAQPSEASSSNTRASSESGTSVRHGDPAQSDDEDDDSPTKGPSASRAAQRHANDKVAGSLTSTRPQRPGAKLFPAGGRTSAKFAQVAEDPGVEGVPPGPRPLDRPGPSFACIIGQAILKAKAGGLSLEHIYRYVETAYPFFKTGDGAWRNSVRHNLSIHKMFETIPRTEKFPPGKGGIWIIHEDEKCHWPEENKFIKNFPASHPHHAVCRQTLHERSKEKEAMDKAAREGRVYVPKKGKKGKKMSNKDDDSGIEMVKTSSAMSMDMQHDGMMYMPLPNGYPDPSMINPFMNEVQPVYPSSTPVMQHQMLPPADYSQNNGVLISDDEEGEFVPMEPSSSTMHVDPPQEVQVLSNDDRLAQSGAMKPPRFEKMRRDKRLSLEDDENVFTSTKKVRLSEPRPQALAPILVQQQDMHDLDDSFVTPEREKPITTNGKPSSSSFRTPALVNTSSSPNSSPLPQTMTRSAHHPSSLQQAWTHDDMAETDSNASPKPMLESAFDFQPKGKQQRNRIVSENDDSHSTHNIPTGPPKTPLSRSSALREAARTPHTTLAKTPMFNGKSPAAPPPSVTALLSTPMWEIGGCLDRLNGYSGSPTQTGRSPVPPTSPTRYAMLLGSGSSSARKLREFNL